MFFVLAIIALLVGLLANKIWRGKQVKTLRLRTEQIKQCPSGHERLFVALNIEQERDAHYVTANLLANARWPQTVTVGVALGEEMAQRIHELLRKRLETLAQPPALADNVRVCIAYSRTDVVSQIVDDCYHDEQIVMVVQGQPLFTEHFDTRVVAAVRQSPHAILTEFPPVAKTQLPGFPVVVGRGHVRIRHFRRKTDGAVPMLLASHQMFAFHATSLSLIDVDYTMFGSQAARFALQAHNRGAQILAETTPFLVMPRTDGFAKTRLHVAGARFDCDSFAQMHGLSNRVADGEAVAKIGSKRRYDDLLRTNRKKNRRFEKSVDDEDLDRRNPGDFGDSPRSSDIS